MSPIVTSHTAKEEGLNVEVVAFRGDAQVVQALAASSVDVNLASLNGLINMTNAGQKVKGFYAGFYQADFEWFARREIKSWADLKGKSAGVSTFGSLTDFLTRFALRKHGLEPEKDVQIVQTGGSSNAYSALQAGKIDSAILSPPFKWQAAEGGMSSLGMQAKEVAEEWPKHIYFTTEKFFEENPNTIRALLRAHVKAIRLAKKDRDVAVKSMMDVLKYEKKYAEKAYDEVVTGFDERGLLPTKWMPVFWEIAVAAGDVKEAWPENKLLDRRYVDTFDEWAPK